jgi:hypothetical protein
MSVFQLSCGHWQSELDAGRYAIGAPLPCIACGNLRTVVVGYASAAGVPAGGPQ